MPKWWSWMNCCGGLNSIKLAIELWGLQFKNVNLKSDNLKSDNLKREIKTKFWFKLQTSKDGNQTSEDQKIWIQTKLFSWEQNEFVSVNLKPEFCINLGPKFSVKAINQ